ncbi:MAG: 23S rRNA (adenine(2503)-C(2))-methyltransferase RlmN [Bacteroidetes bacterium]|nr:23S rRNA (adenine(2503)-C(2))-methyltransferase RlmN [Bacteroidota bacterium]
MESVAKRDIRKLKQEEIQAFLLEKGEKSFRVHQITEWLWKKSVVDFDQMSNISQQTRKILKENFEILPAQLEKEQISSDRTIKSTFKLHDGNFIEGVLIPMKDRMTACVSSQVGCSLSCKFCATGYMERVRNLDASEIYDQVVNLRQQAVQYYDSPLTNIVYMGMGEPLLNYQNVLQSVELITSPQGLNMSPKRITVSTAGIAKMIKKLGDDQVKFNLAVSLHAADDKKRNLIMPINETNSLGSLSDALLYYYQKTQNQITFEYITLKDFNDTLADAKKLHEFSKKLPCKVNIIEYNPISEASFQKSREDSMIHFRQYLEDKGINVKIRKSRGKDIDAACGQLANKNP